MYHDYEGAANFLQMMFHSVTHWTVLLTTGSKDQQQVLLCDMPVMDGQSPLRCRLHHKHLTAIYHSIY